ncbi:CaiB/BaiF CoA-transferase family protein [Roseovarius pacificus]|uniref:CaiB/BaiF CoA-transferase family protein n=1 Tax=Roseovarius pacificus TaxID=337701 RepID=UPI002A18AEB7|nr:CaiB/BaiF CoA-transferase family protein [Roseovarius pacificus]
MPNSQPENPYEGLLVVELGERVSAGAAGSLLAQLGATVVLIEPPAALDRDKWRNRNVAAAWKRSVVLDQESSEDQKMLSAMVNSADIVITSSDLNPDERALVERQDGEGPIVCDITAFGHSGPLAGKPWPEHLVAALAGNIDTTGFPDAPPVPFGLQVLEMHAAVFAAVSVLAALRVRRRDGSAQSIEVALFDIAVTGLVNFVALALGGKTPLRSGNGHPLYRPWGAYQASDEWIVICVGSDVQWQKLCEVMQSPELAEDPRFATAQDRVENTDQVDEIITSWSSGRSSAECERVLVSAGIACGPILKLIDVPDERNVVHRKTVDVVDGPDGTERIRIPKSPVRVQCGKSGIAAPDSDRDFVQELIGKRNRTADRKASTGASTHPPYDDVRVVEIGQFTVAPMASRILGSLGANVIKVESPQGDAIRNAPPASAKGSYIFALSNTDKHGIVLDLRADNDREVLFRLLENSDMLVENLKPGSLARLGVGPDELAKRCPYLVVCAVNGFGTRSAYPGRAALDTIIQAMSGLMSLSSVSGTPIKTGNSTSDMLGGEFSLLALQVGLDLRDAGNPPPFLDIAMQDASLWSTQYEWNPIKQLDVPELIRASDGFVAVDRSRCSLSEDEIRELEAQELDRSCLAARLSSDSDAAVPVLSVGEVLAHPQTIARDLLIERCSADGQRWKVFSSIFRLSRTPASVRSVMSELGETDAYVRENFL